MLFFFEFVPSFHLQSINKLYSFNSWFVAVFENIAGWIIVSSAGC